MSTAKPGAKVKGDFRRILLVADRGDFGKLQKELNGRGTTVSQWFRFKAREQLEKWGQE